MLPLYAHDLFGYPVAMALATVLGLGFGFVLERAGFGRASILVSQFYGTDNRVLKVMFTGIATTTAGLGLFSALGLLDLGAVTVPETWLLPQLVGGVLLGVGFAISGYCPGTALVAAGSGNRDGWWSIGGTMLGGVLFALLYPWLEGFYLSGAMGAVTLPALLGLSWEVLATGVVLMAIGAFLLAEKAEVYFSRRAGLAAPAGVRADRNRVFGAMLVMAALAFVVPTVLVAPATGAGQADRPVPAVQAVDLAGRLVEDPTAVWIVDLRDPARCATGRVPGALCLPEGDDQAAFIADLPATRTLVLYGQQDLARLPDAALAWSGPVVVLAGGFEAFDAAVLQPPALPVEPTRAEVLDHMHRVALNGALTGSDVAVAPVAIPTVKVVHTAKKGGGC